MNEFIDENRLAAIEQRLTGTSKGPWIAMLEGRDHLSGSSCIRTQNGVIDVDGATDGDIEFIGNARQDVPYLISELRRVASLLRIKS